MGMCMQGFTQEFLLGRGEKYWVPNFCLPCSLLAHYAANEILHTYFTSWKIAPGVHGVLDKIK